MYCANCGKPAKEGETYCKKCAKKMRAASAAARSAGRKAVMIVGAGAFMAVIAALVIFAAVKRQDGVTNTENVSQAVLAQSSVTDKELVQAASNEENRSEEEASSGENISEEERSEQFRKNLVQEREERILALSEQEWLLKEAARSLVADRLAETSFVTVSPREQFSVADVVIDGTTGNLIVSEGARAMYQSIAEGRSVSDICQNTLEGAASQIPQYLTDQAGSALQDMVTSLIGVDIFSAWDFISQWQNADDMPTVLLQSVVDEQQRDVYRLALFLEQEEISAADMYKVAQLMYAIQMRDQEIATVRDTSIGGNWSDYRDLRVLAGMYAANEAELLQMAQTQIPEEPDVWDETRGETLAQEQQKIGERLAFYSTLAETELGDISVNYDVEGFREAQKTISQQGMFGEMLMGNLWGGLYAESNQINEDWVQENRATLCDKLTDFMEESYLEVAAARADFMGQYGMLQEMASATGDGRYLVETYLGQAGWEEQMEEAAEKYLATLSRYLFDIESTYILYDCILTDAQVDFLFDLMLERDQAEKALQSCEGVEYEGYSNEEAVDRWNALLECYMQTQDQIIERGSTLGETPGLQGNGSLTIYGDATYSAYSKAFTEDSKPLAIFGRRNAGSEYNPRYYFDTEGNLLCVVYGISKITYRKNMMLTYSAGDKKLYQWEMEIDSTEQGLATDYTGKAQEMYGKFVN